MKRLLFGILLLAAAAWLARADEKRPLSTGAGEPRTELIFGVTTAEVLDARTGLQVGSAFDARPPATAKRFHLKDETSKIAPAEN